MPTTSIHITSQQQDWIASKLHTGEYNNASEVIREAIRLLKSQDERDSLELAYLRQKITTGLDQAERGEFSKRSVMDILKAKSPDA